MCLGQACYYYFFTFALHSLCTEDSMFVEVFKNSIIMGGSKVAKFLGIQGSTAYTNFEVIGLLTITDVAFMVGAIYVEMIFSSAISLDFIMTIHDSFNRSANLGRIMVFV